MTKLYNNTYEKIKKLGRGGFGSIFKVINKNNNKVFALKKIRIRSPPDGIDMYGLNEIKFLTETKHKNIVELIEVVTRKNNYYLVLEYLPYDLDKIIHGNINKKFSLDEVKYICKCVLESLSYLHENRIIHRDIKPSNILFTDDGITKLIDFGLACEITEDDEFICQATTLPYRAPELLLGSKKYGLEVDIWSFGCMFYEILTGEVLFDGFNDFEMLRKIASILGTIEWEGCENIKSYIKFKKPPDFKENFLKDKLECYGEDAIDLIEKCLILDPRKRITPRVALSHNFLKNTADNITF